MKYTTEKGVDLELKGIAPALIERVKSEVARRFRAEGKPIDPPRFELKMAGGDMQAFPLTERNLYPSDPEEAERRQALWNAYQIARAELLEAQTEAEVEFLFTWGISFDMPEDDSWQRMLRKAGQEIPEDPDELRFCYLWYHLLTPIEVQKLLAELNILNYGKAVSPEDVASFRRELSDSVSRRARELLGGAVSRGIATASKATADNLVQQPDTDGSEGS